jgi:hypothetical protein
MDLRKPTGTLAKYCPAKWINAEGNPEESLPTVQILCYYLIFNMLFYHIEPETVKFKFFKAKEIF